MSGTSSGTRSSLAWLGGDPIPGIECGRASWMAWVPMPLDPPWISSSSQGRRFAVRSRVHTTVHATSGSAAAVSRSTRRNGQHLRRQHCHLLGVPTAGEQRTPHRRRTTRRRPGPKGTDPPRHLQPQNLRRPFGGGYACTVAAGQPGSPRRRRRRSPPHPARRRGRNPGHGQGLRYRLSDSALPPPGRDPVHFVAGLPAFQSTLVARRSAVSGRA